MAACTLDIGARRVLVSEEGPPAAEFALFDASDIELAPGEGGVLREVGYRTTAADAIRRLAVAGVTLELANECGSIVQGRVARAYARGALVRHVAPLLGPQELFDGGRYDATLRRYEGTWLDLPLLANDAGVASATGVLHASALAVVLGEVASDTPVVFSTLGHGGSLRLGERTLRRHAIANLAAVPRALRHLAEHVPPAPAAGGGAEREELLAGVRERLAACVSAEAREHLARLESALQEPTRPSHGPLSDPEVWEVDQLLDQGEVGTALRRIEVREANSGREPATIYLRARAALIAGKESPRAIAQRIGQLALSMSNFPEVELLAAQAWNAAGETRNAFPFARDLATNPRAPASLRAAAESILRAPRVPLEVPLGERDFEGSSGELRPVSVPPPPPPPTTPPPPPLPRVSERPPPVRVSERPPPLPVSERPPPPAEIRVAPESRPSPVARSVPPPQVVVHDSRTDLPLSRTPSDLPPRPRTLTPPGFPLSSPPVQLKDVRRYLTPPERIASPLPPRTVQSAPSSRQSPSPRQPASTPPSAPSSRQSPSPHRPPSNPPVTPRSPGAVPPSKPPRPASDPPAQASVRPGSHVLQPAPWPTSLRAPREENSRPEDIERTPSRSLSQRFMRGASMPPVASEPPTSIPRAPVVPRVDIDEAELIETLPLPRGASDASIEPHVIPRTPLEARIRFSMDARELARRYRREEGIDLRLETRAVAALQRHLAQRFAGRLVSTPEEAREAELHGALLSELLARLLDAEWVDISPTELGYWAMAIPLKRGGAKRVWPFGRVLRYIAGGGEDDLVAFVKKLRELS